MFIVFAGQDNSSRQPLQDLIYILQNRCMVHLKPFGWGRFECIMIYLYYMYDKDQQECCVFIVHIICKCTTIVYTPTCIDIA